MAQENEVKDKEPDAVAAAQGPAVSYAMTSDKWQAFAKEADSPLPLAKDELWYLAYGSNMSAKRMGKRDVAYR